MKLDLVHNALVDHIRNLERMQRLIGEELASLTELRAKIAREIRVPTKEDDQ